MAFFRSGSRFPVFSAFLSVEHEAPEKQTKGNIMIDIIIAAAIGLLIYGYWRILSYNGPAPEPEETEPETAGSPATQP